MLSSNFALFNATACLDDNLGGTICLHDSPTDGWLKIDLGAGNEQEYTKTRFYGSSQPGPATQFQIQYSDDGATWSTVGTITMPISETSTWHELTWTSVGAHRYWHYKYLTGWRSPAIFEIEWYITSIPPCTESWTCTSWSSCINDQQTRTCTDSNNCGTTANKPATTQSCTCTESWTCTAWSSCINGQQTRTCTDANNCGTTFNKPTTTQSCTCTESWSCGAWSACVSGQQTRTCADANNCGTIVNKPVITQSCTCVESWNCNAWSNCINDQQTRTCTDINNCGTIVNKPATTQSCIEACIPSWSCTSWSSCINNQKTRTCIDSKNCNNDQGKPIEIQNCIIDVNPPTSATSPNVIVKDIDGIIDGNDGKLIFEISNADSNHKIEGYLSCNIPSDVIVTSSVGAASGSQSQYISQTFTIDSAPSMESMSLSLSSPSEGMKYVSCTVNYVLYKEGKGYLTSDGQYSSEKKYFIINAGRDVSFNTKEGAKTTQETVQSGETIEIPKRVVWGVVVFVVLLLAFLLDRTSKSN